LTVAVYRMIDSWSAATEHACERAAELGAHGAVDEEVCRIGEQDDQVDEDGGSAGRVLRQ